MSAILQAHDNPSCKLAPQQDARGSSTRELASCYSWMMLRSLLVQCFGALFQPLDLVLNHQFPAL